MFDSDHEDTKFNLRRHKAMSLGAGLNKIHMQHRNFDEPDGDFPAQEQSSFLHSKCKKFLYFHMYEIIYMGNPLLVTSTVGKMNFE